MQQKNYDHVYHSAHDQPNDDHNEWNANDNDDTQEISINVEKWIKDESDEEILQIIDPAGKEYGHICDWVTLRGGQLAESSKTDTKFWLYAIKKIPKWAMDNLPHEMQHKNEIREAAIEQNYKNIKHFVDLNPLKDHDFIEFCSRERQTQKDKIDDEKTMDRMKLIGFFVCIVIIVLIVFSITFLKFN